MPADMRGAEVTDTPLEQTLAQTDQDRHRASDLSRAAPAAAGYAIVHRLGAGTFGEVWLARQEKTGIQTAVKFFTRGGGLPLSSLQEEVRQLARLHADPGIVQLLDVEPAADPPYYVMALAERGSLADRLAQGPLPAAEAVELFRQVAEALAYVHVKGIRHCDLKPGNVLLDIRGRPLLADFSQSRLGSSADPALGTFFYMAPEQADLTQQPDPRWDVYALGAVLYTMLTGQPPFATPEAHAELGRADGLAERLRRYREWLRQAARPTDHRRVPGVDGPLADLIDQCLALDPAQRLSDAAAVLGALARRETALAQLARQEFERRRRPLLAFGFVGPAVLLLLMGGLVAWALGRGLTRSQEALTQQLMKGNQVSAQLAANVLERELLERRHSVEVRTRGAEFRRAVAAKDARAVEQLLERFIEDEERTFESWIVVDEAGKVLGHQLPGNAVQLAALPLLNFTRMDWFHGQGNRFGSAAPHLPPITRPHISQPSVRLLGGRELLMAFSAPVFAPEEPTRVVGVFAAALRVDDLRQQMMRVEVDDGFAVLLDARGHCVVHRDMAAITPPPMTNPPRWDCPTYRAARQGTGTATYPDPVDGQTYLTGYAALPRLGWGMLYQHERADALAPMAGLTTMMVREGFLLLVLVVLMLAGMWGLLVRLLRQENPAG